MEPHISGESTKGTNGLNTASPEPVYRFYLSPPPAAPMQPGIPPYIQQQQQQQQQGQQPQQHPAMFQSPLGLYPFATPYMSLSPPPQTLPSVSAFGQPAYYAPSQQSLFYPSAYALPAMATGSIQPRMSTVSSSTVSSPQSQVQSLGDKQRQKQTQQDATVVAGGELDSARAKMPIVNEVGVPMGGFGVDQDGQYIEIKFPTFGQAQVQQMLQQLHIQQQQQQQQQQHDQEQAARILASSMTVNGIHQPQPTTKAPAERDCQKQQQQQKEEQEQKLPTPISAVPSVAPGEAAAKDKAGSNTRTLDSAAVLNTNISTSAQSPNISIYDAEHFANAHMEDIVFDSKAFFWKIDNWDKLERRATSDVFKCGGHIWRILLRPFGSSHKGVLSLFLECLGTSDPSDDWRSTCRFVLAIANPHDPSHNTHGSAYHCFHRNNPNWGFTRFMKLADLRTAPAPGIPPYIEDGACTIGAYLHVIKEPSQ
ncbi:ubiquitin-specific protease ubp15 [Coemansia umbellata]|uniref:Ubiquitin-specific protease ubp15 n=1 Tax=Coemansia umbellata TaxID=1424467 RepID=A0ABQ8PMJ6_9FUNG|nr:ubiquitin-specific protease ubp15 [Coemansia umbellata]